MREETEREIAARRLADVLSKALMPNLPTGLYLDTSPIVNAIEEMCFAVAAHLVERHEAYEHGGNP